MINRGFGKKTAVLAFIVMLPTVTWAKSHIEDYRFGDTQLASVILAKDDGVDVQRKLGSVPCAMPAADREVVSQFFRTADGKYLRFDVNSSGVESMTISQDPIITQVCYAPLGRSVNIATGKGVRLGDSIDQVTQLYGEPKQKFQVGSLVRFRYDSDGELDRYYEWDLVFRNGHLVEWTAYSRD